jgi:malate dehydrogenase (oxaloacetate-decarboxylating)
LIETGLTEKEALKRIFTIDSRGLVTTCQLNDPYKCHFARAPEEFDWYTDDKDGGLVNVIRKSGTPVLIGTSGQPGCFDREVVEAMLGNCERPVILPLSNPTSKAEAVPDDIYAWTNGRALVATGSPFDTVNWEGKKVRIGQGNNVFVFPGVGLGVLASGAKEIVPEFFTAAAHAVSDMVSAKDLACGVLYPPVTELREVSRKVALAVGGAAIKKGVSRPCVFSSYWHENDEERLETLIDKMQWSPQYLPLIPL